MLAHAPDAASRDVAPYGASALALGGLGTLCVVVAVVLSVVTPRPLLGLVLASAGVLMTGAGLVLGTLGAVRARARRARTAIVAAGLSVAGLAGGLIWLAAYVVTGLAAPDVTSEGAAADPASCSVSFCP